MQHGTLRVPDRPLQAVGAANPAFLPAAMNERERVESLFEAALELDPSRRSDFVAAACGDNAPMQAAVMQLLRSHARASGVLDVDPATFLDDGRMPPRLGAYRLLREIGRGGMGIVYDAERDDGQFRRRVAIKIIRGADPEVQRHFLAERQILAALDHPNIARLLDSGVTPEGSPYIVMEHVEGLPVDVYCERMRLTITERLQLFATIARAVDFAHRNLIVHRDLKPSNILVTPDGRAKLLDFGVAKLLNPWLMTGDAALMRERGMTLEYASPEQLRGESLATTSDVYSLGVLFYELLAGRRPHQQHESAPAAHAAAVCEAAVQPPSQRVLLDETLASGAGHTRQVEAQTVARGRQTTPQKLAKELRGDLDAVAEMALRTEPHRRYGSAELFALDIDRHLTHRTVRAHAGGRTYALGKLIRRHRLTAAAVLFATLAILFGAGGAAWQARIAERERDRAELAMQRSEQVASFLLDLFDAGDQPVLGVVTGRDLVRRGSSRIDQLSAQPDVQARLLGALGAIYENLGDYEEGQRMTERALELLQQRGQHESAESAALMVQLGSLMRRRSEPDSAQALFFRARDIQERVLEPSDPAIGRTLHQLARIAIYLGDFAEAERRARESLDLLETRLGESHRVRVNLLTQLGAIQRARGNRAGAEQTLRRAIELRARSTGSTRDEALNDRLQLATIIFADTARSAEAEALFRAELPLLRADAADDVYFLTWAEGSLAELLLRRGDSDGAEQLRRHIHEVRLGMLGPEHPATAEAALLLGQLVGQRGRLPEGERLMRDAADTYRRTLGDRHPTYAQALVDLSDVLVHAGRHAAADSAIATAVAIRLERYGPQSHGYTDGLRRRARIQTVLGQFAAAETMLRQSLDQTIARSGSADSGPARAVHRDLAELYTAWGRPAEAARHRELATAPS
jgi:eukaryotic-like serine/threonine-protein kinase